MLDGLTYRPQAMLLDLDGTLADSLDVMRLAYREFLGQFHVDPDEEEFRALNGPPLSDVVHRLRVTHGLQADETILRATYFDIIDCYYARVVPFAGASDLLRKAKSNGALIGIVTSTTAKRARNWLEGVGFAHSVDFIVAGEEVRRGKPDPEPYLLASIRASCASSRIVAVEDSAQGAQSALAAGLKTFVLTHGLGRELQWPASAIPIQSLDALAELLW
jgi:HAD superfamily hydrolase (TIGR01509 family)